MEGYSRFGGLPFKEEDRGAAFPVVDSLAGVALGFDALPPSLGALEIASYGGFVEREFGAYIRGEAVGCGGILFERLAPRGDSLLDLAAVEVVHGGEHAQVESIVAVAPGFGGFLEDRDIEIAGAQGSDCARGDHGHR